MPTRPDRLAASPSGAGAGACLVAVDGSDASVQALVWGLRHATHHNLDVEVLTVWPPHRSVLIHEVPGHFCAGRWHARSAQNAVIQRALQQVPDGRSIVSTVENADAAEAIVRASARYRMIVIGSNSQDRRHRLTDRITEEAQCEVVVVEDPATPRQRLRKNLTV